MIEIDQHYIEPLAVKSIGPLRMSYESGVALSYVMEVNVEGQVLLLKFGSTDIFIASNRRKDFYEKVRVAKDAHSAKAAQS